MKKGLQTNKQQGFSLVETLFYVSIMVFVLGACGSAIYSFSHSYRKIQSAWAIESAATSAMERMTREARNAYGMDLSESILDTSPGQITLDTKDENGASSTVEFYTSGQTLRVKENGVDAGPLTPVQARVTNLVFRYLTSSQSEAVKIEMTVESGQASSTQSKNFYSTVVMRDSYSMPYPTPYAYQYPYPTPYATPYSYQYQYQYPYPTPYATPYSYQYQYQYQYPTPAASCSWNGASTPSGGQVESYHDSHVDCHCSRYTSTCSNGTWDDQPGHPSCFSEGNCDDTGG